MAKAAQIKNELQTIQDLMEMTKVLEETAARDISQMRERIVKSRPYFQEAWKIYRVLLQLTPPPPQTLNKHLVIAVTLEWGMTGSLLTRVLDKSEELYDRYEADLLLTGKMGRDRFMNRDERTVHFFSVPKRAEYGDIEELYKTVAHYAQIHFVYPRFESLSNQEVTVASLSTSLMEGERMDEGTLLPVSADRFVVEPDAQAIMNYMSEVVVGLVVYSYFNEALLAYSAAQMVSMRSASDNAKEQHKRLLVHFNKARREQIDAKLRELYEAKFSGGGSI